MNEDEAPAAETFQDRVNKQMLREMEEANRDWVRAQKLTDYLWQQKLDAEAPLPRRSCRDRWLPRAAHALRFYETLARSRLRHPLAGGEAEVKLSFEQLLNGEGDQKSVINEPLTPEPPRESATARAMRRWFKKNPTVENESAG